MANFVTIFKISNILIFSQIVLPCTHNNLPFPSVSGHSLGAVDPRLEAPCFPLPTKQAKEGSACVGGWVRNHVQAGRVRTIVHTTCTPGPTKGLMHRTNLAWTSSSAEGF